MASPIDYNAFMDKSIIDRRKNVLQDEIMFWQNRLNRDTGNFVDMLELSSQKMQRFKMAGDPDDLIDSDSLLTRSTIKLNGASPDIFHNLSQAAITRHRFRAAELYNRAAISAKADPYATSLLSFDVCMELGFYSQALLSLQQLANKSSFDYLIRKAKWEDHRGNLPGAIGLMEKAFEKIKHREESLYCWTVSNLGDMYGHAGDIERSYAAYLDVLKKDSGSLYALKGIAWVAYSHDGNIPEARRILQYISSQTNMPDTWLMLAELEEYAGNTAEKMKYIRRFIDEVEKPGYGDMYNKYLIGIYTEEIKDYDKALALAQKEVDNRPTPETYDWLALVNYYKGNNEKALAIARSHVYQKNFEPEAVMHTAMIYAANGKKAEARQMFEECLSSSFEIGPVKTRFVHEQLRSL